MFKRVKPLVIHGRTITLPGAAQLAEYMTEERALFVAHLRLEREYTWRMIAEDCGKAWGKNWGADQSVGATLCGLAAAFMGEDWDYLDTL